MSLFPAHLRPPEIETTFELDRILQLPRRSPVNCERRGKQYTPEAQALAEYVTEKYALPSHKCRCQSELGESCITLLNPAQAWTLRELRQNGGVIGLLPVGSGKTIISILAPLAVEGCRVAILLAKPDQRLHYERAYLRLREHFKVPHLTFYDKNTAKTTNYRVSSDDNIPALHFIAYSQLSQPDSTILLEQYNADLIICDEAHAVSARNTSRTGRLLRYLAKQNEIRFCAWSGTLVKKSIRDQAHLVAHALGDQSPMPLDPDEVDAWAAVFDPSPTPDRDSQIARRLYDAFDKSAPTIESAFFNRGSNANIVKGFRTHLLETPGIVSTRESAVAASNYFHEFKVTKMPSAVKDALMRVRTEMVRPDGDILVDKLEQARTAREVASGFFYYWAFIHGEPDELIESWFAARKKWNKELRVKLLGAEPHMDSPLLCANAAERAWRNPPYEGELPTWKAAGWPEWRDIRDQVEPDPRVKWLDDFMARDVARWAKDHTGIVWCQSSAFGKKVAELAGLHYHGGGPDAEKNILAEKGDRSIIASIKAHGTGRDGLQKKFHEQLVAELPSSGDLWQQCLDEKTEILTREGWKSIDDSWGAEVAAYSIEDESITWQSGERIERKLGSELMYGISNSHLDIRVTAGHRMICEQQIMGTNGHYWSTPKFVTADQMPRIGRVPLVGRQVAEGLPLSSAELYFIGLFMTDGNYSEDNDTIRIFQSERYPEFVEFCEQTIKKCGFHYRHYVERSDTNFGKRNYPLHRWCIASGKNPSHMNYRGRGWWDLKDYLCRDRVLDVFEGLTSVQLCDLLQGMWVGDGSKTSGTYDYDRYEPKSTVIHSAKRTVVDSLQSLCVRRGLWCNISFSKDDMYHLHISTERSTWTIKRTASNDRPLWGVLHSDPNERVWCARVPSGAIVTRRNGKVVVLGNCLGRLCRPGQEEDEVHTWVPLHVIEFKDALRKAMRDAEFTYNMTGNEQFLMSADFDFNI